jgi:hypothetical protein
MTACTVALGAIGGPPWPGGVQTPGVPLRSGAEQLLRRARQRARSHGLAPPSMRRDPLAVGTEQRRAGRWPPGLHPERHRCQHPAPGYAAMRGGPMVAGCRICLPWAMGDVQPRAAGHGSLGAAPPARVPPRGARGAFALGGSVLRRGPLLSSTPSDWALHRARGSRRLSAAGRARAPNYPRRLVCGRSRHSWNVAASTCASVWLICRWRRRRGSSAPPWLGKAALWGRGGRCALPWIGAAAEPAGLAFFITGLALSLCDDRGAGETHCSSIVAAVVDSAGRSRALAALGTGCRPTRVLHRGGVLEPTTSNGIPASRIECRSCHRPTSHRLQAARARGGCRPARETRLIHQLVDAAAAPRGGAQPFGPGSRHPPAALDRLCRGAHRIPSCRPRTPFACFTGHPAYAALGAACTPRGLCATWGKLFRAQRRHRTHRSKLRALGLRPVNAVARRPSGAAAPGGFADAHAAGRIRGTATAIGHRGRCGL